MTTRATAPLVSRGAAAMVLVGSSVAVSHALTDAPLLTAQGWRYAAASLLLVVLARAAGVRLLLPRGTEWLWLLALALSGLVVFNVAVVRGVEHAEPAVIGVAVAGAPVLIGVLGPLLEGRAPTVRAVAAAGVVAVGSALVAGAGVTDAVGVLWAVVALLCEAAFTLLAVPLLPRHTAWGVSVHGTWIAAVLLVLGGLVTDGPGAVATLTLRELGAMAYLAVLVTAAAFVLWYGAVAGLGSARAALLCGIAPVSAALLGIATTGIAPAPLVWLGIAVVLAGLVVGLRPPRPAREPEPVVPVSG